MIKRPLQFVWLTQYVSQEMCHVSSSGIHRREPSQSIHLAQGVHIAYTSSQEPPMSTIKVGVREFRERIATFLESDTPVAVTRRGETLGVYVPTPRKRPNTAEISELKAAAARLASALDEVDEEEVVAEFKQLRRGKRSSSR